MRLPLSGVLGRVAQRAAGEDRSDTAAVGGGGLDVVRRVDPASSSSIALSSSTRASRIDAERRLGDAKKDELGRRAGTAIVDRDDRAPPRAERSRGSER